MELSELGPDAPFQISVLAKQLSVDSLIESNCYSEAIELIASTVCKNINLKHVMQIGAAVGTSTWQEL